MVLAKVEFSRGKVMKESRMHRAETEAEMTLQVEEAEEIKESLCFL